MIRAINAHVYEVHPRKDKRGVDLISDVLPFGRLWYGELNAISNAIGYAQHCSRSHHAVLCCYFFDPSRRRSENMRFYRATSVAPREFVAFSVKVPNLLLKFVTLSFSVL
jgi:hypothetical protein